MIYPSAIGASSFDFDSLAAGGSGPFRVAGQVLNIGVAGNSGWIAPVPEPTTGVLLGLSLLAICGLQRPRR